jgi:phenylacetate-CoA ligase
MPTRMTRVLHDLASRLACVPLSNAGRLARAKTRPVYRSYVEGLRFRQVAEQWSDDHRREWVLGALRRAVRRAAETTSFYGERLQRAGFDPRADFSFDDYARLPVLERGQLRAAGHTAVNAGISPNQLLHDATGGSTGVPTEIWKGPEERGWGESGSEYFMRRIGIPNGSSIALLWGHNLDPVHRSSLSDRLHDWWFNVSWYDCFRLSSQTLRSYHEDLQRRRPQAVVAYAGALASLAEFVAESGDQPDYPRCAFVTGAEKLFAHQREVIEQTFGRLVHERYGSRDVGLMGFQVDPRNSLAFEVDWANVLVEPADDSGTTDILITKLHADGMPMIRYRVGDMGRFPAGARPGHPALQIEEVVGRDVGRIWLRDGRWVHGISIPHLMKDYPVREFQLVQHPDLAIEVRIVPADGYSDERGRQLLEVIQDNVVGLPVSLSLVAEIPRTAAGKWHPVVSQANLSSVGR